MTAHAADLKADQLLKLSEEVHRIAGTLAQISRGVVRANGEQLPKLGSEPIQTKIAADTVNWLIRIRKERRRYLPEDIFAEPAWDMLLDLLHAELGQRRVSVSSLCIASGVPNSTALRWIKSLSERGLILRRPDPFDARRWFVELSAEVSEALRRYVTEIVQQPRPKTP